MNTTRNVHSNISPESPHAKSALIPQQYTIQNCFLYTKRHQTRKHLFKSCTSSKVSHMLPIVIPNGPSFRLNCITLVSSRIPSPSIIEKFLTFFTWSRTSLIRLKTMLLLLHSMGHLCGRTLQTNSFAVVDGKEKEEESSTLSLDQCIPRGEEGQEVEVHSLGWSRCCSVASILTALSEHRKQCRTLSL